MATAVETSASTSPTSRAAATSPLPGSLIGALVFLAGFLAAGPISNLIDTTTLPYKEIFQIGTYVAVVLGAVVLAGFAAGTVAAPGVRGGIIITTSLLLATLLIASAIWKNAGTTLYGQVALGVFLAIAGFVLYRLFTSNTGLRWCRVVEEQGWASFFSFKKNQGLKVRRYTMIGVLLVGCTGAWALYEAGVLPAGSLVSTLPFTGTSFVLMPQAQVTVPLVLIVASIWLAWRLVNAPDFGDFLISTEAEMNKVSWVTRKRLIQDTIVVLVCVVVLTLFLLFIDLFWGWLLSRNIIGVLPSRDIDPQQQTTPDGGVKLKW